MIRKIVCLLLMPAFMVKSTALSCPHVHAHAGADHSSVVHFHFGGHSHHGHDHDHDLEHDHPHGHGQGVHGHRHHDDGPVDENAAQFAHRQDDASDVSQLSLAEQGVHGGELLVFGSRVDLSTQLASKLKARSSDATTPKLVPPAPNGCQVFALQRTQAECSPDRAFLETRQLLGLYDCARIPLFLQILCLLI